MKVILKSDVKNLGEMGAVVTVKDGYARNYLIPQGLAVYANEKNMRMHQDMLRRVLAAATKLKKSAELEAEKLSKVTLTIKAKAGEEGKLFGAVTTMDIADALKAQGFEIDRRKIQLAEPIKRLGEYQVKVALHSQVFATVNVLVVQDE